MRRKRKAPSLRSSQHAKAARPLSLPDRACPHFCDDSETLPDHRNGVKNKFLSFLPSFTEAGLGYRLSLVGIAEIGEKKLAFSL